MVFIEVFIGLTTFAVVSVNAFLFKKMLSDENSDPNLQVYGVFPTRFGHYKQVHDGRE